MVLKDWTDIRVLDHYLPKFKGNICFMPIFADSFEGVPPYPLYKRLATALHETTLSRTLRGTCKTMEKFGVYDSSEQKEHEWQRLISEKGSQISDVSY